MGRTKGAKDKVKRVRRTKAQMTEMQKPKVEEENRVKTPTTNAGEEQ